VSYNIDSISIVHSEDFSISENEYHRLKGKHICEVPECSVFDEDAEEIRDGRFYPRHFWWCGDGSGHTEPILREVLSAFDGEADLVITWEGGDSFSGLRLRNHKVTEHEIDMRLGDEVTP
jgi:hypothetical protein